MNIYESDKSGITFFWDTAFTKIRNMAIDGLRVFRPQVVKLFPSESYYSYFFGIVDLIQSKKWGGVEADNFFRELFYEEDYTKFIKNTYVDDGANGKRSLHIIINEVLEKQIDPTKMADDEPEPFVPLTPTSPNNPVVDKTITASDNAKAFVDKVKAELTSSLKTYVPYLMAGAVVLGWFIVRKK